MKFAKALNNNKLPIFILGVALFTLTPIAFFAYLLLIIAAALLVPLRTSRLLVRLLLSFLMFYSICAILGAGFWLISFQGLFLAPFITGIILAAIVARYDLRPAHVQLDLVAVLLAAAVMTVPLLPFLNDGSFASLLQTFAYQGDNLSHLELTNANAREGEYVYYTLEDIRPFVYQTLSGYPQAWHYNAAIFQQSLSKLFPVDANGFRQILFFYSYAVMLYGLLAIMTYELIIFIATDTSDKRNKGLQNLIARVTAAMLVAILLLGTFMTLFAYGFQTHIASLLFVLMIGYLLVECSESEDITSKRLWFLMAAMLCVGLTMTWQVIALPVTVVMLYMIFSQSLVPKSITAFYGSSRFFIALLALVVMAGFQFYILMRFGNDATSINQPGLSPEPQSSFVLLSTTGGLLAAVYLLRKAANNVLPIAALLVSSGIFSLLLYIIMEIRIGQQLYYYFKSTFTIILLMLVLVGAAMIYMLATIKTTTLRAKLVLLLGILITGYGGIALNISGETQAYYKGTMEGIDRPLAEALAEELRKPAANRSKILALGSCIPDQDYKASRIAQALSDDEAQKTYYVSNPFDKNFKYYHGAADYSRISPEKNLLVLSHDEVVLQKIAIHLDDKARWHGVNLDPNGPPKDPVRCPNFVEYK